MNMAVGGRGGGRGTWGNDSAWCSGRRRAKRQEMPHSLICARLPNMMVRAYGPDAVGGGGGWLEGREDW